MALRIVFAVLVGGGIGLAIGMVGRSAGGQCPIVCNPYISTGLGVFLGLLLASRSGAVGSLPRSPNLLSLDSEAGYEQAIAAGKVVLVEFYTNHCPACRAQLPALNELADEFAGKAAVATVNASQLSAVAAREGIEAVPTMLIFRDGKRVEAVAGMRSKKELAGLLDRQLAQTGGSTQTQT